MAEFLDVVDDSDNVVGKVEFSDVYEKKLKHRIVHIFVYNDEGKMLLQKRSMLKSFCPGHWSTPVGGHVQSGETYEEGALREYEEELGVKTPLKEEFYDFYSDGRGLEKFLSTFSTINNGPFPFNEEEVSAVEFFTLDEIRQMLNDGEPFHPELKFLLEKHFA